MSVQARHSPSRITHHASRIIAPWRARWHAVAVMQRRELRAILVGPGIYVALALGMGAALLNVRTYLDAIARQRLLVLSDAFTLPFFVAALVLMLYLALTSAVSIAREREQGTLEVLFYGPVDAWSYVLAKHLAQVASYLVLSLALALLLLVYAGLSGLQLGGAFPFALALSVATAAAVAAAGIFVSALMRGAWAALALLAAVSLLLLALQIGSNLLGGLPVANNASSLLFLRDLVIGLDAAVGFLSPIAVFERGVDAAVRGSLAAYAGLLLLSLLHGAVLLAASVWALRRRGVRR